MLALQRSRFRRASDTDDHYVARKERPKPPPREEIDMSRRLSWAVRLVVLVGIAGGLSGCAVYATPGYAYRSPGYYPAPAYRPYSGGGYYGRPGWGGGWGGHRGYYGRPYW